MQYAGVFVKDGALKAETTEGKRAFHCTLLPLFSVYPCFYSQPPPLTPGLSPWGSRFISPSLHSCQETLQDGSQPQPNNNPHCHKQTRVPHQATAFGMQACRGHVSKRTICRLNPASFYISLSEQPHACTRFLPFSRASMAPLAICGEMVLILTKEKQNKIENSFAWSLHILWAHCISSALRYTCSAMLCSKLLMSVCVFVF